MRNIGKELEKKLKLIGIDSAEALRKSGSKEVFFRLKTSFPNVCLVHLYALQGAIDGLAYNELSAKVKWDLKDYCDMLR